MKYNIAIDGPSGIGKSTVAKLLAKELHYTHLDTGAMYRCVALQAVRLGVDQSDEDALLAMVKNMKITFDPHGNVYINGEDVSLAIRENRISMITSNVSIFPKIRQYLVTLQRAYAKNKGCILDGRDIGTTVLPNAWIKIYLVASVKARALRRYKEYVSKHIEADYATIYEDIQKRDQQDMNRKTSPLRKADDAFELDTSDLSIEEVMNAIRHFISEKHC